MKKHVWSWTLATAFAAVSLSGCGGTSYTNPYDRLPAPTVRFLNAVPDSTAGLTFSVDNVVKASGIGFRGSSADFEKIGTTTEEDGATDISVSDSGSGLEYDRFNDVFSNDTDTLIIAYGKVNSLTESEKTLLITRFNLSRRVVQGKARLFIFNAYLPAVGVDTRQINFQSADPSDPLSAKKPQFITSNINYGVVESQNLLDIDPGTRLMQARDSASDAVTVVCSKTFTFEANKIYVALVSGQVDASDPAKQPTIEFIPISTR